MSLKTATPRLPQQPRSQPTNQPATSVGQLQQQLFHAIDTHVSPDTFIASCLQILRESIRPAAVVYYRRKDGAPHVVCAPELSPPGLGNVQGDFLRRLDACCSTAADADRAVTTRLEGNLTAIAVPVLSKTHPTEVIGIIPAATGGLETSIALLQVVASHITLSNAIRQNILTETESANASALVELLVKVQVAPSLKHACLTLVNELQEFLGCQAVAMGLSGCRQHDCRLTAVSGMSKFDAHSEFSTAIEAAMDEAILKDRVTVLPTDCDLDRTATLAHQRAATVVEANTVVSSPLKDEKGNILGAWIFFGDDSVPTQLDRVRTFVNCASDQVGSTLNIVSKATRSPLQRQLRLLSKILQSSRSKFALLITAFFFALMLLPMEYKIGCACRVQPVVRRFVAAPYDGKLERTFVEPGDEVKEGDVLARLDGRELRWELAGVEAEYNRAAKSRDAAMAVDNIGEAQQAALEKERLALKIQLIRNRLENLEIRSPLDGIVVSGDLRKAEGAPLAIGQTLFEIAPLERMILEVDIPERDVLYVEAGQQVAFRVDASPFEKWSGQIRTVFPQSEIRDNESVYVAEVDLENRSAQLRPGMKGQAKVISGRHALGWNLFHRPYESFCMLVGW